MELVTMAQYLLVARIVLVTLLTLLPVGINNFPPPLPIVHVCRSLVGRLVVDPLLGGHRGHGDRFGRVLGVVAGGG